MNWRRCIYSYGCQWIYHSSHLFDNGWKLLALLVPRCVSWVGCCESVDHGCEYEEGRGGLSSLGDWIPPADQSGVFDKAQQDGFAWQPNRHSVELWRFTCLHFHSRKFGGCFRSESALIRHNPRSWGNVEQSVRDVSYFPDFFWLGSQLWCMIPLESDFLFSGFPVSPMICCV